MLPLDKYSIDALGYRDGAARSPSYEALIREPVVSREFQQVAWSEAVEDDLRRIVRLAVREDLDRFGDLTTLALVPEGSQACAGVVAMPAARTPATKAAIP